VKDIFASGDRPRFSTPPGGGTTTTGFQAFFSTSFPVF
jgi:hypothetical protein